MARDRLHKQRAGRLDASGGLLSFRCSTRPVRQRRRQGPAAAAAQHGSERHDDAQPAGACRAPAAGERNARAHRQLQLSTAAARGDSHGTATALAGVFTRRAPLAEAARRQVVRRTRRLGGTTTDAAHTRDLSTVWRRSSAAAAQPAKESEGGKRSTSTRSPCHLGGSKRRRGVAPLSELRRCWHRWRRAAAARRRQRLR